MGRARMSERDSVTGVIADKQLRSHALAQLPADVAADFIVGVSQLDGPRMMRPESLLHGVALEAAFACLLTDD